MKKIILILLLFRASNCFALPILTYETPLTKNDKVFYITSSLALLYIGFNAVDTSRGNAPTALLGSMSMMAGYTGLYYTFYEW